MMFFFQAEDGIRDLTVTGVQTCALPILAETVSLARLTGFLALRRNTALLLGALLLAGTGEKLWLGFAPKYLEFLGAGIADRKSTCLNSSHSQISYAVFCLKKKSTSTTAA